MTGWDRNFVHLCTIIFTGNSEITASVRGYNRLPQGISCTEALFCGVGPQYDLRLFLFAINTCTSICDHEINHVEIGKGEKGNLCDTNYDHTSSVFVKTAPRSGLPI